LVGWPTPRSSPNENRNTKSAPSHGETHGLTLAGVAHDLTGWPTASARDWRDGRASKETMERNSRPLNEVATALSGWSTPRSTDGEKGGPNMSFGAGGTPLPAQAAELAGWKTPLVPSGGRRNPPGTTLTDRRPDGKKVTVDLRDEALALSGTLGNSSDPTRKASTGGSGALNPKFVAWLMMGDLWPEIMACAPLICSRREKRKG